MLFNSYPFVFVFLPLVLAGFAVLVRWRARRAVLGFLIIASLTFYAWWDWRFLPLILFSILFNFFWGRLLRWCVRAHRRATLPSRGALAIGIAVNLGLLGYFKYRNLLVETAGMAIGADWHMPALVLPLAISFFTFEQITYQVDVYYGTTGSYDFLSYCLFITFFPHLIAGPIVRFQELVPQFTAERTFGLSPKNMANGLLIFAIGLFKKVVIADTFSGWVGPIFDQAAAPAFSDAWGGALAYALQLYFDFSGYTDMAIGLALMLNIVLPENFDSPYKAQSIIDFWRRWHMTLSSFLRDYLYIPLSGRGAGARRLFSHFLTMFLGGLWHGASWTFALWGGLHGVYVATNYMWRRTGIRLPGGVAWAITFLAVMVGWVFFRAPSLARAHIMLEGMVGLNGFAWSQMPYSIGGKRLERLIPALVIVLWGPNRQTIMTWRVTSDWVYALAFAILAGMSILRLGDPSPFLYFQF